MLCVKKHGDFRRGTEGFCGLLDSLVELNLLNYAMKSPDQQQNSADRSRRSGRGLLPMQAMSRRCSKPFRLKRRLKR
jgi:hypothetical protein